MRLSNECWKYRTEIVCNEDVAQEAATMFCARDFGNQDRRYSCQGAGTKTGDHTSNEDEIRSLRGCLQSSSDKSEDGGIEETVDSSDTISSPTTHEATNNGSEIVLEE
jgi:hypothetical protein